MKLLFITQKVDKDDAILGFVHNWLEKLSKHFDRIIVICLQKGSYQLPANVEIISLGKELRIKDSTFAKATADKQGLRIFSSISYLLNFYRTIFKRKDDYDAVFVHMNSIYVLLGGWLWHQWRKKVVLWYNHKISTFSTRIAFRISDVLLYTSPFAASAKYKKSMIMPAGIDTELFKRNNSIPREKNSILYLGRISPVKNIDVIIGAVNLLDSENLDFKMYIVGSPVNREDSFYEKRIHEQAKHLVDKGKVIFKPGVTNNEAIRIYNECEIFVNSTLGGSLDKTVLEAMASEMAVAFSNESFLNVTSQFFFDDNKPEALAAALQNFFNLSSEEKVKRGRSARIAVQKHHDLDLLINKIKKIFYGEGSLVLFA